MRVKYEGKFFISEKLDVNGKNTHPAYNFLRTNSPLNQSGKTGFIPWNFTKILVDGEGQVNKYYPPSVDPIKIVPDIEKLLKKWVNYCLREN